MKNDLFLSKKSILWQKLYVLKLFSSHKVREIGLEMFYDSCDRVVRKWAEEGKLRRLDTEEIFFRRLRKKGQAPLAWYEVNV